MEREKRVGKREREAGREKVYYGWREMAMHVWRIIICISTFFPSFISATILGEKDVHN